MKTWIRALCLIGIVAAPNVVEISEAWAEPKRQAADDLMKEGWLSSLMARVSPKAADEAAPFRAVAPSPLHQIVRPLPQRLNLPRNALGMQAARGVSSPNTVMHL